jgi:hypothetical protein
LTIQAESVLIDSDGLTSWTSMLPLASCCTLKLFPYLRIVWHCIGSLPRRAYGHPTNDILRRTRRNIIYDYEGFENPGEPLYDRLGGIYIVDVYATAGELLHLQIIPVYESSEIGAVCFLVQRMNILQTISPQQPEQEYRVLWLLSTSSLLRPTLARLRIRVTFSSPSRALCHYLLSSSQRAPSWYYFGSFLYSQMRCAYLWQSLCNHLQFFDSVYKHLHFFNYVLLPWYVVTLYTSSNLLYHLHSQQSFPSNFPHHELYRTTYSTVRYILVHIIYM